MSVNLVLILGNMTRDPQLSFLPSNTPLCEFGLAVNEKRKGKDGNTREDVTFIDCKAFGKTAETINQYFKKGKPIFVQGRLQYREWVNKEGQKRSKLDVIADSFSFVGPAEQKQHRDEQPQEPVQAPAFSDDPDLPF